MDFVFADDAAQPNPTRQGVKPLLAIGGLHVPGDKTGLLETAIREHCRSIGFPDDEQFKWSPGKREKFEKSQLVGQSRTDFFIHLLGLARDHGATATVVVTDTSCQYARSKSSTHEADITALFLERCDLSFKAATVDGVAVIAKPSGGKRDQAKFVSNCLDLIRDGTEHVSLNSMALGALSAPSRQIRLLQLADVIASCTVARIGGESPYSIAVFEAIVPLLRSVQGRIGGVGLKLHPDHRYVNLYHWLLGDTHYWRGNMGRPLPLQDHPYAESSCETTVE